MIPFHKWTPLTIEEAETLARFIEQSTASKNNSVNYEKMQKVGILDLYNKLDEFISASKHYENNFKYHKPPADLL